MAYQIPPDLEARVKAQLTTGRFDSEDEVLREALDTLEKRQRGFQELQSMVAAAEDDIAAGLVAELDIERTIDSVRARLDQPQEPQ